MYLCDWKMRKECVAVLTMLYKKNGAVSGVGTDKQTTPAMVYTKVIDVPGIRDGLNLIMGRLLIETATYSFRV